MDFAGAGVVAQGPSHFLVGHGLSVALATPPHLSEALLILGGELEGSVSRLHPPDAATHLRGLQHLIQELEQTLLPLSYHKQHNTKQQKDKMSQM